MHNRLIQKLLALVLLLSFLLFTLPALSKGKMIEVSAADYPVAEDGVYSSMEEVAVYIATYQKLPGNFITKNNAAARGWDSRKGNLDEIAPGSSIGGDRFGNYEQQLPDEKGRKWTECDIGFNGGYRGGERIVFSNDGLIYYTGNHYQSFSQVKVIFPRQLSRPNVNLHAPVDEYGEYTSLSEVASYLLRFETLPCNYLTRDEAKELGWTAKKDNLAEVMPGCSIGGDIFQNREKKLPTAKGRIWKECDINAENGKRSDERLLYSNDGLLYYTPDGHKNYLSLQ